jgi:hypothetical protein
MFVDKFWGLNGTSSERTRMPFCFGLETVALLGIVYALNLTFKCDFKSDEDGKNYLRLSAYGC